MTLVRPSSNLFKSFPSLFDSFFEGDMTDWANANFSTTNTSLPAVNVKETDDDFKIEVAAPGMTKKDFKVNLDNGKLTISSERQEEDDSDKYTRREFSYQSFQRVFTIPENLVDGDKINAKYDDGILYISLPKKEEAKPKPAKEIKIS